MIHLASVKETSSLQVLCDEGIGLLNEHPLPGGDLLGQSPPLIDGLYDRQIADPAQLVVVGTEGRGNVDNAGSLLGGDEVGQANVVSILIRFGETEVRFVAKAFELGAGKGLQGFTDIGEQPLRLGSGQCLVNILIKSAT